MTLETTVTKYTGAWAATFSLFKKPILLVPFAVVATLKAAPLVLAHYYWHPWVSGFMVPALESLFGEQALHFPEHVPLLADIYQKVNLTVMIVVGFVMIGWAVLMMTDVLQGKRLRAGGHVGEVLIRVPSLLLIGFVFAAGVIGPPMLASKLNDIVSRERLQQLLGLGGISLGLWFQAMLVYSPFFLKSSGGHAIEAMRRSVEYARTWLGLTAMVIFTAWIVHLPLDYLIANSEILLVGLGPDSVFVVLILKVILEMFTLFYLFASTTFIAMEKMNPW